MYIINKNIHNSSCIMQIVHTQFIVYNIYIKLRRNYNMLRRLLHWLRPHKGCKRCCLTCPYYKDCVTDFK